MKNLMKFTMIAMLAIGFVSCDKDEETPAEESTLETIVGKWIKTEHTCDKPYDQGNGEPITDLFAAMDEDEKKVITEFTEDGKVVVWAGEKAEKGKEVGTYTLEDKLLVIKYIDEDGKETSAQELEDVTLKDGTVTLTEEINKASDDGVNTYTFTIKYKKLV